MIRQQFIRYAMIGVLLNAALYGSYLLLTHTVMGSRAAMSITYCVGVLIGFLLNRKITFSFRGDKVARWRDTSPATPSDTRSTLPASGCSWIVRAFAMNGFRRS